MGCVGEPLPRHALWVWPEGQDSCTCRCFDLGEFLAIGILSPSPNFTSYSHWVTLLTPKGGSDEAEDGEGAQGSILLLGSLSNVTLGG